MTARVLFDKSAAFHLQEMAKLPAPPTSEKDAGERAYQTVLHAIVRARLRIELIKKTPYKAGSFKVIEALEMHDEELDACLRTYYSDLYDNSAPALEKAASKIESAFLGYYYDVYQDAALFALVEKVYQNAGGQRQTWRQKNLASLYRHAFVYAGVRLTPGKRANLRNIGFRLTHLAQQFEKNLKETRAAAAVILASPARLAGLSPEILEIAAKEAAKRGQKGKYALTPAISGGSSDWFMMSSPIMAHLEDRALREKIWRMHASAGATPARDNSAVVIEIARLRHAHARLLGFKSHAHEVSASRMIRDVRDVAPFLDHLLESALPAAQNDHDDLAQLAMERDGIKKLEPWDIAYYAEKLRTRRYGLEQKQVSEYLPLEAVLGGFFMHAKKLFGLGFHEYSDPASLNPDIRTFDVFDTTRGKHIGTLRLDLHARPNKYAGAWMLALRNRRRLQNGSEGAPIAHISCNFPRPSGNTPPLLTGDDVRTLFHEGGHALHELLSKETYPTLSGTNVDTDVVELPSLIQENWATEPETLALFARHYETGKPMPRKMAQKIHESRNFMAGFNLLHHLHLCYLDAAWHLDFSPRTRSIDAFERKILQEKTILDGHGYPRSTSFMHAFGGSYSFAYYGYEWSQRMADHAYGIFRRKGIYNKSVAEKFRKAVLARNVCCGWTQFRAFTGGRNAHKDASLHARGLKTRCGPT